MTYSVIIDPNAIHDIQKAIDYYDERQLGLGLKFETELNKHILALESNPFYQIRYEKVRCLPLKKFPYTIHFTLNDTQKLVIIRAVFHMALNPQAWSKRK